MLPKPECAVLDTIAESIGNDFYDTPLSHVVNGLFIMIQPLAFVAGPCTKLANTSVHQLTKLSLDHVSHLLFLVCFE